MTRVPQDYTEWIDCPASYHNGAGGISFADGHAQIKKWTDATVLKKWAPPTIEWGNPNYTRMAPTGGTNDLWWLQSRSTGRVGQPRASRGRREKGGRRVSLREMRLEQDSVVREMVLLAVCLSFCACARANDILANPGFESGQTVLP